MSTSRDLAQINELAPRLVTYYTAQDLNNRTIWDRMYDDMAGHPNAAAWDDSRTTEAWCWAHGRAVQHCHIDGHLCMGDPMSGPSDPTGQAATSTRDTAADDERRARDIIRQVAHLLVALEDIGTRYKPARPASLFERELTADPNAPHCESCARHQVAKGVPWIQDVHSLVPNRSTVAGSLPEPMYLCRWCYEHVWSRGVLPDMAEVEFRERHKGQDRRVRCPHEKVKRDRTA